METHGRLQKVMEDDRKGWKFLEGLFLSSI
jgi:hypothetical protein